MVVSPFSSSLIRSSLHLRWHDMTGETMLIFGDCRCGDGDCVSSDTGDDSEWLSRESALSPFLSFLFVTDECDTGSDDQDLDRGGG